MPVTVRRTMRRWGGRVLLGLVVLLAWKQIAGGSPAGALAYSVSRVLADAASGPVDDAALTCVEEVQVPAGGTPADALLAAGLAPQDVYRFLRALDAEVSMRAVRPSDRLWLYRLQDGTPVRLDFQRDPAWRAVAEVAGGAVQARRETLPVRRLIRRLTGEVRGSLWESVLDAGGDPAVVVAFSDLFAWSFDFLTDTRDGDRFDLLVEERRVNGERDGFGPILAATYRPRGSRRDLEAYRFETGEGEAGYYDAEGHSLRRQFLKSPLNYRRISSRFTYRRRHPILRKVRPHLGIDYAAPTGTPVVALGRGKVVFAGWNKGFGRTVKIRHDRRYLTQYAHLSRIARGIRPGVRVDQGQVIGYVGSTGLATGPHLDFRVRENGRWINPLRLRGGRSAPLDARHRTAFASQVERYRALLRELAPGGARPRETALGARQDLAAARLDTPAGG